MRVRIFATLGVAPTRATELARDLSQPIGKIAYHLTVLSHAGYAARVDDEGPDPRYESSRT